MKGRLSIILLVLAFCTVAKAQTVESIRSDADYLWAEGKDVRPSLADNKAIDKLLEKLSASDILPVEEWVRGPLWKTYRNDIRSATLALATPDGVMRYIAWRDVEKIFVNRWRKVKELVQWAQKSVGSDPDVARTYISWAETYLASLPPVEPALRKRVEGIRAMLGNGRTDAVHLRRSHSYPEGFRATKADCERDSQAAPDYSCRYPRYNRGSRSDKLVGFTKGSMCHGRTGSDTGTCKSVLRYHYGSDTILEWRNSPTGRLLDEAFIWCHASGRPREIRSLYKCQERFYIRQRILRMPQRRNL